MRSRRTSRRMPEKAGTMFLPRASQVALWVHELTGQLSDGMWEGAGPNEHWRFWCRLDARLAPAGSGDPRVETPVPWLCYRDTYGFSNLYFLDEETGARSIQDRMVKLGRLALACELTGNACGYEQRIAAEGMPETYDECLRRALARGEDADRFAAAVPTALARAYYDGPASSYDVRQMKSDIKVIKQAMKNRVVVAVQAEPTA